MTVWLAPRLARFQSFCSTSSAWAVELTATAMACSYAHRSSFAAREKSVKLRLPCYTSVVFERGGDRAFCVPLLRPNVGNVSSRRTHSHHTHVHCTLGSVHTSGIARGRYGAEHSILPLSVFCKSVVGPKAEQFQTVIITFIVPADNTVPVTANWHLCQFDGQ